MFIDRVIHSFGVAGCLLLGQRVWLRARHHHYAGGMKLIVNLVINDDSDYHNDDSDYHGDNRSMLLVALRQTS